MERPRPRAVRRSRKDAHGKEPPTTLKLMDYHAESHLIVGQVMAVSFCRLPQRSYVGAASTSPAAPAKAIPQIG